MQISFRQGIVKYQHSGNLQNFLQITGNYVSFSATNDPTFIAFAYKTSDYLLVEGTSVSNAWGPFTGGIDYWLYWDIDTRTGNRTFGSTRLLPTFGNIAPPTPAQDQHWFDTNNNIMKVRVGTVWKEVIRVFACYYNNAASILPFAAGQPTLPFAGTQVNLNISSKPGKIFYDEQNPPSPIRRDTGEFLTDEDQFFITGTRVNGIRLESSTSFATAMEAIPAFSVVALSGPGQIRLANYEDAGSTVIAMATESVILGKSTSIIVQGLIQNPNWTWPVVGALLWIDVTGQLTTTDPHSVNNILHPTGRVPVGRVFSTDTIIFDQGMGGKGDQGPPGAGAGATDASVGTKGIVTLSVPPIVATNPIAVGDNDPRLSDARAPTAHTHPATAITLTPTGAVTGSNVQLGIQQLEANKIAKSGDTMTGFLTLHANPTLPFHAATKNYVDSSIFGLSWLAPIEDPDLASDGLSSPPGSPNANVVYLVNAPGLGAWAGLAGHVVKWNGASWTDVLGRAVQAGDRFGITMEHGSGSESGSFVGKHNQIVTVTNASPGSYAYTFLIPASNNTVLVNNALSEHFGHTYAYQTLTSQWIEVSGPTLVIAGDNLAYTGNVLNVINLAQPLNQIAVGTGTGLTSSSTLIYNSITGAFSLLPTANATPGDISLTSASADVGSAATGGHIGIVAGSGDGISSGGSVDIEAGTGGTTGAGGTTTIAAGQGGATSGDGGNLYLMGGSSPAGGTGGDVNIQPGNSTTGTGGVFRVITGNNISTEKFVIDQLGAWTIGNTTGNSGQVLTSNGVGTTPTWEDATGIISQPINQIVYGTGTGVSSDAYFVYDITDGTLSFTPPTANATPGDIIFNAASTTALNTAGGTVTLIAGNGNGAGIGGTVEILAGTSNVTHGSIGLYTGGSVFPRISIAGDGEWLLNNVSGALGEVLTANGPGNAPTWQPNTSVAPTITKTNNDSVPLTKGMPVYISSAGNVTRALAISFAQSLSIGLVTDNSVGIGSPATILNSGIITATTGDWDALTGSVGGLVEGSLYYLGTTFGTLLTTTAPTNTGDFVVVLGIAVSSTQLIINISLPIGI